MNLLKEYEAPAAELIAVDTADVLTSSGFVGEDHEFEQA